VIAEVEAPPAPLPMLPWQGGENRFLTLSGRLTKKEREIGAELEYPHDIERPKTRGECADGERPCPWVSCKYHLAIDVNEENGALKVNFPHLEVWDMPETCALDVADRGGIVLERAAELMNLTRERVRQVELVAVNRLRGRPEVS
jgi:hypothetical protein